MIFHLLIFYFMMSVIIVYCLSVLSMIIIIWFICCLPIAKATNVRFIYANLICDHFFIILFITTYNAVFTIISLSLLINTIYVILYFEDCQFNPYIFCVRTFASLWYFLKLIITNSISWYYLSVFILCPLCHPINDEISLIFFFVPILIFTVFQLYLIILCTF